MSLIHKALKKVEESQMKTGGSPLSPEEQIFSQPTKKNFYSTSVTPRTLGLVGFAFLSLLYAIYTNFIADNDSKKGTENKVIAVSLPPAVSPITPPSVPELDSAREPTKVTVVTIVGSRKEVILPPGAKALKKEGEKFFMAGNMDGALRKFTAALTKAPTSSAILNSIGLVFKKKGKLQEADRYYNQAIKHDAKCYECYNNLAVLKVQEGDNVSAVMHLKKAIKISETYADPYFNLAVIMEKEGNYKSAVENYKWFLTYTPMDNVELKEKIRSRIEDLVFNWEEGQ